MLKYRLNTSIHISWMIAWTAGSIVIGVALAPYCNVGIFSSFAWVLFAVSLLLFVVIHSKIKTITFAIVAGLLFGLWRGSIELNQLAVYDNLIGKTVVASGTVAEDADIGKNGEILLRLKDVSINQHEVSGKLWVSASAQTTIKRSDKITVEGEISEGFGSFPAAIYRPKITNVERPEPGDVALHVRDWFSSAIRRVIPEPQASLGVGYLVGQRRALPPKLEMSLKIAGLTHVVVASGYNLTILVRLARRLFEKVSKYLATLASGVMIVSFIAVTGLSPSMSRAGLIAGLSLAAWYYGRKFHPLVLLPFAAGVTVLFNPSYAWNDLGWQLSFAAFAGVMLVAPIMQKYFFGDTKPSTIRQILGETIAAQIATLPILIVAFGYVSNVAILANILVLPLVPLAMLLTFIAGIASLALPGIAHVLALPANWLLQYMVAVAEFLAHQPWAQTTINLGLVFVILFYVVLAATVLYMKQAANVSLRDNNIVE